MAELVKIAGCARIHARPPPSGRLSISDQLLKLENMSFRRRAKLGMKNELK